MQYPVRNHAQMGMNALNSAASTAARMDKKKPEKKAGIGDVAKSGSDMYRTYSEGKKLYGEAMKNPKVDANTWSRDNSANIPNETPMEQYANQDTGVLDSAADVSFNQHELRGTPDTPKTVQAPTPKGGVIETPTGGDMPKPASLGETAQHGAMEMAEEATGGAPIDGAVESGSLPGASPQAPAPIAGGGETATGAMEMGEAVESAAEGGIVAAQGSTNAVTAAETGNALATAGIGNAGIVGQGATTAGEVMAGTVAATSTEAATTTTAAISSGVTTGSVAGPIGMAAGAIVAGLLFA